MGFKFFYLPSHRVFNLPTRYYNKDLEKFDGINEEIKNEKEGKEYVPGSIIRRGFRRPPLRELKRSDGGYGKGKRIIVYILIVLILVALFYFTRMFYMLFQFYQTNG